MCKPITDDALMKLRAQVEQKLSPFRFTHTLGVEEAAAGLSELYAPEVENDMRAAALLHDVTKEWSEEKQRQVLRKYGVSLRRDEDLSPKIFHGITAALIIPDEYPDFAKENIISAVRWHTTGRKNMTLTDMILYLADYIERGRKFASCVRVRAAFFDAHPEELGMEDRKKLLKKVFLMALSNTVTSLEGKGFPVCADTREALLWMKA